jgi:hypothetical protein
MTKISSKYTRFYKKGFPLLWFGFLAVFIATSLTAEDFEKDPDPMFFIIPVVMAVFGFFLMKKLVWDLVDEVYDGGEFLLVKNRGAEDRVPLSNVMNVNASTMTNPPRVTLRLVKPGKFGNEVAFSPAAPFTLNPFAKNEVAEGLIVRVDQARTKRAV